MKKSDIFKAFAILGVFGTAYLTAKAVPYFEDYYEEWVASKNFSEDDKEKFEADYTFLKQTLKAFTPAMVLGASTIASIILLDKDHVKQEVALLGQLYSVKKVIGEIRKDPDIDLSYSFKPEVVKKVRVRKDEILVYEPYTDQIFPTTMKLVEKAEIKGNKRLNNYYFETLNRFIKDLGGKACAFGDILGWSCDKEYQMEKWKEDGPYLKVTLTPQDVDGRDVYVMDYDVNPLWL